MVGVAVESVQPILGKDSFEKKVVNFHNFGPDPPSLEVVKGRIFFLLHDQKNIMGKLRKILP